MIISHVTIIYIQHSLRPTVLISSWATLKRQQVSTIEIENIQQKTFTRAIFKDKERRRLQYLSCSVNTEREQR